MTQCDHTGHSAACELERVPCGIEKRARAATAAAVESMYAAQVREDMARLERQFPGEPDRAIEDDWFTYARGAQPVALGDVVQIGPGCFRAVTGTIEE